MIDKALESIFVPYKLIMKIIIFFMSSVAQLEADIFKYFHVIGGYVGLLVIPVLTKI